MMHVAKAIVAVVAYFAFEAGEALGFPSTDIETFVDVLQGLVVAGFVYFVPNAPKEN